MPRPGYPHRAGTVAVDPAWATHHRPTVEGTMTGRCTIRHLAGTDPTYDPTDGSSSGADNATHYDGLCRVQILSVQDHVALFGEQEITVQGYLITTTMDNDATQVDDVVAITEAAADSTLVGRQMTVAKIMAGTLVWERDLVCLENLG